MCFGCLLAATSHAQSGTTPTEWQADSPWPLSNNPDAKYNERSLDDCNLDLPLWQIVRASTAAPTFFPPETVYLGNKAKKRFVFVDGGVTMFNNPAFQLFEMANTATKSAHFGLRV